MEANTEPTNTELSPGTTDEENNYEDITEIDDMFSTLRTVAEGKSDSTQMVAKIGSLATELTAAWY